MKSSLPRYAWVVWCKCDNDSYISSRKKNIQKQSPNSFTGKSCNRPSLYIQGSNSNLTIHKYLLMISDESERENDETTKHKNVIKKNNDN